MMVPHNIYGDNICWTKATNDFQPFESEYEGWTGNAGNTLDRWYHRAAIIAWRQIDHYAVMLEFSQSQAMSEIFELTKNKSTLSQAQDELLNHLLDHHTLYPVIELSKLLQHFYKDYQSPELSEWDYSKLTDYAIKKLMLEVKQGPRKAGDWSIQNESSCRCNDCQVLTEFLQSSHLQQKVWPLAKQRRRHIHGIINCMRLPVTHNTEHTGSPHKLILKKTNALFTKDRARFNQSKKALNELLKFVN